MLAFLWVLIIQLDVYVKRIMLQFCHRARNALLVPMERVHFRALNNNKAFFMAFLA